MALPATAATLLTMAALLLAVRSAASTASASTTPASASTASAVTAEPLLRAAAGVGTWPTAGRTTLFRGAVRLATRLAAATLRFFS
jgi:hypothetical protein